MKLALPYYEWRYLAQPMWLHGREAAPYSSTETLVPALIREDQDYVIRCIQNPRIGCDPNNQPALAVDGLNSHLQRAMHEPGGVFRALAAQTIFISHIQRATAKSEVPAFELQPPTYSDPILVDMLAPSLGWLIWNWQLEALIITARCTTKMSQELVRHWRLNYQDTEKLLMSLQVGNQWLGEVLRECCPWGDALENMTVPYELEECFARHGLRQD